MVQIVQVGKKRGKRQIRGVLGCVKRAIAGVAVGTLRNAVGHDSRQFHYARRLRDQRKAWCEARDRGAFATALVIQRAMRMMRLISMIFGKNSFALLRTKMTIGVTRFGKCV
jgi:hypothetical protein